MKNFKLQLFAMLAAGICVAFFITQAQVSYAYVVNKHWATNTATFGYGSNYPTGAWRDRAVSAASAWTNVDTSSWTWNFSGTSPQTRLYYQALDGTGGALGSTAVTPLCGSYVCTASITIDWDETFYTGTGLPPSSQYDLQSLLTHEFGHAAALGHTNVTCSGSAMPTMCPTLAKGTTFIRGLEIDDRDGISNAYP